MLVVFGVWVALAGAVAALAGFTAARRRRRLRGAGRTAWATVVPAPSDSGERHGGFRRQVSVQFALEDGRIIERRCGQSARKLPALDPGQKVLVWYDLADPDDVLIFGHDGRRSDLAFMAVGVLLIAMGTGIAALGG
jgi:hypothetical protein